MRIKNIISQHRRDFTAYFECEHCGAQVRGTGYDDANFHNNVLPKTPCVKCGKTSPSTYVPQATKYSEGTTV